jgi:hypothetical protein
MQGLIREARDLQGIRKDAPRREPEGAAPAAAGPPSAPTPASSGSPRKKS